MNCIFYTHLDYSFLQNYSIVESNLPIYRYKKSYL